MYLLILNGIGMGFALAGSLFYGFTGYLYFFWIAIPMTTMAFFIKVNHPIQFREIWSVFKSGFLFWIGSYALCLFSISVDDYIIKFGFLFMSMMLVSFFVTERLPGIILSFIPDKLQFSGYYQTTLLTMGTIFCVHTLLTYHSTAESGILVKLCVFLPLWILPFLAPFLYIRSFESLPWSLPTRFQKILFMLFVVLVYSIFLYFIRDSFRYPSCC